VFRLAYNTNGLAHHRVVDALELLADLGYRGVAITPDVGTLDPLALDARLVAEIARVARARDLELALETGARYVLDPRRKHWPTLLDADPAGRARRLDFLLRTVDLASELGASLVSLWAGRAEGGEIGDRRGAEGCGHEELWKRLAEGVATVLLHAAQRGVRVAFEPEPGMFVERPAGYEELVRRLGSSGQALGLCLDVGHCLATRDLPVPDVVRRFATRLAMVQLDDGHSGEHEHRMFGSGELDLAGTLRALRDCGYRGLAAVELSRESHRGPEAAREAMDHLLRALPRED
jgi:sugar phosphate isomerase/epimerase